MIETSIQATCDPANSESDLHARAACLINPCSGIANDFLNHFNEIFLLVENLTMLLPEMVEELLQWSPITYGEYFRRSRLPGSTFALSRYEAMDPEARAYFDNHVSRLNDMAVGIVAEITSHRAEDGSLEPKKVSAFCEVAANEFRAELDLLATFVNCGFDAVRS